MKLAVYLTFFLTIGALITATAAETPTVAPGKRVALVVGNGAYRSVTALANPANDAELIARTLKEAGFTLVGDAAQFDLDKPHFDQAVQTFGQLLVSADVALFYYSGHGMQVGGENWLVPVDANPTRMQDLDFQMVDASLILRQMDGAGTRLNLVILDACRNNPFASRGLRAVGGGLAEMRAPEGTLISYATQPGNVAADGIDGHSPYTSALAAAMHENGLDVFQVFNHVGLAVKRTTGGSQQPWVASSPIAGSFYFFGPVTILPPSQPISPDPDTVFWQSISGSTDPGDYRLYLQSYPDGHFAALARKRSAATPPASGSPDAIVNWTADQRRRARLALRVVGYTNTPILDGPLTEPERVAVRRFSDAVATRPLLTAAADQLRSLPDLADKLKALLVRGDVSPAGLRAAAVPNAEERYAKGWAAETRPAGANAAEAAYWYALAARLGDVRAFTELALLEARGGMGLPADSSAASLLWWIASLKGDATASFDLGAMFEHGISVPANNNEALRWYSVAAAQGSQAGSQAVARLQLPAASQ